jgi:putative ABC transport system substrate-binding protein
VTITRLTALVAVLLLGTPLAAETQGAKVYGIGYLSAGSPPTASPPSRGGPAPIEAFREGLRELGYVEGQNVVIHYRWAETKLERLPALAAELIQLKVDVIVAAPTEAIRAAKQATRTIPIVMAVSADPVAAGLVASLAHPGGNVTGLSVQLAELSGEGWSC